VRKRFLLSLAGLTACGLSPLLCTLSAQTTSAPATQNEPAPQNPPAAIPTPTPESPRDLRSVNPYGDQTHSPQSVPAATPAQPQVVLPPGPNPPAQPIPPTPPEAYVPYGIPDEDRPKDHDGSAYIPLDSWVYLEMDRLNSMGYLDTMYLSMRPYTRRSALHMLKDSEDEILQGRNEQAQDMLAKLLRELAAEKPAGVTDRGLVYGPQQVYERGMYISGTTLRDSYHIGQTIVNDYGRPYEPGYNNILGGAYLAELGRFSFYARGEYQHAPSAPGYTDTLADELCGLDQIDPVGCAYHQATIPRGPINAANPFRLVEATLSFHIGGHEISGGKSDAWLGPARGGALAWSNNAENIYSFRINRVEPLRIPLVSRLLGPVRYDFFYGSLKGHSDPNHPWVHSEMFAFRPTVNFEFGFQRTIIFGGAGHEPVTIHTFLKGFFDTNDTTGAEKYSRDDPGARFSAFNFSYRLPFVRRYATFYTDSIAHDDVTPISAPRRAAFRTGLYLSQLPKFRKLELRAEAVVTDPRVSRSFAGQFNYFETIQKQGYTNQGFIMGDWIGREGKGGQAWATYHVSPTESYEVEYLRKKNAKDFIDGGTTQNQYKLTYNKRFAHDFELNYWLQYEKWKAPIYQTGLKTDTTVAVQLSYYPKLHTNASQ
jgi:hypothetical protein